MQKLMVNQTLENMGIASTQTLATLLDGIARHSPEGVNFKQRAENVGWKQAVRERDQGSFDWTKNQPFKEEPSEDKTGIDDFIAVHPRLRFGLTPGDDHPK